VVGTKITGRRREVKETLALSALAWAKRVLGMEDPDHLIQAFPINRVSGSAHSRTTKSMTWGKGVLMSMAWISVRGDHDLLGGGLVQSEDAAHHFPKLSGDGPSLHGHLDQ
jgi:hypothetical protein